jgi:hypothetical protein
MAKGKALGASMMSDKSKRPLPHTPSVDEQRIRAARQAMLEAMLKDALDG